jgi:hypothetical protein
MPGSNDSDGAREASDGNANGLSAGRSLAEESGSRTPTGETISRTMKISGYLASLAASGGPLSTAASSGQPTRSDRSG